MLILATAAAINVGITETKVGYFIAAVVFGGCVCALLGLWLRQLRLLLGPTRPLRFRHLPTRG